MYTHTGPDNVETLPGITFTVASAVPSFTTPVPPASAVTVKFTLPPGGIVTEVADVSITPGVMLLIGTFRVSVADGVRLTVNDAVDGANSDTIAGVILVW
jgi:hypothetical protein